ncbi:MAG: ACP S-malonyltransferase [Candidatus Cloacimonetes bacterium]|nr:ACP S-malonyltransferase [Candidatus Cloacimonadota bacterium]
MPYKGRNLAFIFPGQGAQYVGMAMDYIAAEPRLENVLRSFDSQNGVDLFSIMNEGPEEALKETRFTQPAILFHSVAAMQALQQKLPVQPDIVAGHSLGEFTALVAAGILSPDEAMYLVHRRGQFMIEANEDKPFAMAAILGLGPNHVKEICEMASEKGIVIAANYNTPVQTVISGSASGVARACEIAQEARAKRIVPLAVGGPFHSPLIEKARGWLAEEIGKLDFTQSDIPLVSNVSARPTTDLDQIKRNLAQQVTSSVRWVESMKFIIDNWNPVFLEFGPQRVLAGMMRKIDKQARILSVDKLDDVPAMIEKLEEICSD